MIHQKWIKFCSFSRIFAFFILTYIFLFRLKSNWVKNSSFGFFFLKLFWCEYLNPFTYCSLVLVLILFFSSFDTWDVTLDNQQEIDQITNRLECRFKSLEPYQSAKRYISQEKTRLNTLHMYSVGSSNSCFVKSLFRKIFGMVDFRLYSEKMENFRNSKKFNGHVIRYQK